MSFESSLFQSTRSVPASVAQNKFTSATLEDHCKGRSSCSMLRNTQRRVGEDVSVRWICLTSNAPSSTSPSQPLMPDIHKAKIESAVIILTLTPTVGCRVFGKGIFPFPATFKGKKTGKVVLGFKASLMFTRQGTIFMSPVMSFDKTPCFGFKMNKSPHSFVCLDP